MPCPPVEGVIETSLYVDDIARSVEFYQRVFGFTVVYAGDRVSAMEVAGRHLLLLFKKGASVNLPLSPHDGDGQLHLAFAISASSLTAWKQWLAEQAVEIVEECPWERGGISLYFRDPDGHLLEVATPGVWQRVY